MKFPFPREMTWHLIDVKCKSWAEALKTYVQLVCEAEAIIYSSLDL